MDGNIERAAWVLGGCILAATVVGGVGLMFGTMHFSNQVIAEAETASKRASEAVLAAPANTQVKVSGASGELLNVGFQTPNPPQSRSRCAAAVWRAPGKFDG